MDIWTVYRSPRDYPGKWVARRFELDKPTQDVRVADTLQELQAGFQKAGMVRLARSAGDDPVIVECWL